MTTVVLGMLFALALALAVVALVAVPARREGRELLSPQGEQLVQTARERTAEVASAARDKTVEVAGAALEKTAEVAGAALEKTVEVAGATRERVAERLTPSSPDPSPQGSDSARRGSDSARQGSAQDDMPPVAQPRPTPAASNGGVPRPGPAATALPDASAPPQMGRPESDTASESAGPPGPAVEVDVRGEGVSVRDPAPRPDAGA